MTEPTGDDGRKDRRTHWIVGGSLAALTVVASIIIVILVNMTGGDDGRPQTEEDRVTAVVDRFAAAVDSDDGATILAMLCAEEAETFAEDANLDPEQMPVRSAAPAASTPAARVTAVRITGDIAAVSLTLRSGEQSALHLLREAGEWKVCAPAGEASPAPSPSQ